MRLLVTTINRQCPADTQSGSVYEVDTRARKVIARTQIPEAPLREFDPNPRGGMRGGRGITINDDSVFIANFSAVFQYNCAWRLEQFFSHPACADIHEIKWHDGLLWVTSTRNDRLVTFDANGAIDRIIEARTWHGVRSATTWNRPEPLATHELPQFAPDFRDPTTHSKADYDGMHLNALCFLTTGEMLVSLGLLTNVDENADDAVGKSCVVRLTGDGRAEPLIVFDAMAYPIHNLVAQPDNTALLLDTSHGHLLRIDASNGTILSRWPLSRAYLRGLCRLHDGTLAVGAQNQVLILDPGRNSITHTISLSENSLESVHSIHELPLRFEQLPFRFESAPMDVSNQTFLVAHASL